MLPNGWNDTTLGAELKHIKGGGTPSRKKPSYWSGNIPWATVKDLITVELDETEEYITETGLNESASNLIPAGTVIIATRMALGKAVRFSQDVAINQDLKGLYTKDSLSSDFLLHWLIGNASTIEGKGNGSTVKGISLEDLRSLTLLLPPLPEQKKIAAILNSVDEAIAKTQAVIDQTRKVKQGLLQQLLTRGISHTKFKDSAIGKIPESWEVKPLHDIATVQTGLAKGKQIEGDSVELPYLRVANVQDGYLDLSEIKMIRLKPKDIDRYQLKPGDVLLTEGGDLDKLGRGDIWRGQIEKCLHQNHVFAVRPNLNILTSEFLAAQTSSNYGKQYFLNCAKQTTNLASINSTQLKNFPTIVPPICEQKAIIKILDSVRTSELIAMQELKSLEMLKCGLMQDLLTGRVRVKGA